MFVLLLKSDAGFRIAFFDRMTLVIWGANGTTEPKLHIVGKLKRNRFAKTTFFGNRPIEVRPIREEQTEHERSVVPNPSLVKKKEVMKILSTGEVIGTVGGVLAVVSAVCAIVTFFIARGKDNRLDGEKVSDLRNDIKYLRNEFDEFRLDIREMMRKLDVRLDAHAERITRCEESMKTAHKRLDRLEDKVKKTEP